METDREIEIEIEREREKKLCYGMVFKKFHEDL